MPRKKRTVKMSREEEEAASAAIDYADEEVKQRAEELASGEIPEAWRHIPFTAVKYGLLYGYLKVGWRLKDYIRHAAATGGYECVAIWGQRGSGKSSYMLRMGYMVYEDWDTVLKNLVFRPEDVDGGFLRLVKQVPSGERVPWIGWDDIGVHFPSVSFKTQAKRYEAIDATWAAIRTKINVIALTIPLIDRLAHNIKDSVTLEAYIGRNQLVQVERYLRLPGLAMPESNFFKALVEPLHRFDLYDVPRDVFEEYWDMRTRLTEEAVEKMSEEFHPEKSDQWVGILEASDLLDVSPQTLMRYSRDGFVRKIKGPDGMVLIRREDLERVKRRIYNKRKKRETGDDF